MVLTVLVVVLVPLSSVLADGGSPTTKPLGLTSIKPGWCSGMMVMVGGNTPAYANPNTELKLGTILEVVEGQIPNLPPRVVRNWSSHQKISYAAPIVVNGRVAVLPVAAGLAGSQRAG